MPFHPYRLSFLLLLFVDLRIHMRKDPLPYYSLARIFLSPVRFGYISATASPLQLNPEFPLLTSAVVPLTVIRIAYRIGFIVRWYCKEEWL